MTPRNACWLRLGPLMTQDYNYREYAMRRARKGFEMARGLSPSDAAGAFAKGQQELEVVRRQAVISRLYPHQVWYLPFPPTCSLGRLFRA